MLNSSLQVREQEQRNLNDRIIRDLSSRLHSCRIPAPRPRTAHAAASPLMRTTFELVVLFGVAAPVFHMAETPAFGALAAGGFGRLANL